MKIRYARTQGEDPVTKELDNILIPANSSKEVSFPHLQGEPNLQNSFLIVSDGSPGDVAAKLVARSDSQLREVEQLGKDLMDPHNGGNHPWSIEDGTESTLLLFNTSDSPQFFDVAITGAGVTWHRAYQLKPMQTKAISINDLINHQTKDDKGVSLPKDAWKGQVDWYLANLNTGRGRILQSNRENAMARDFSCVVQIYFCSLQFTGPVSVISVGQTVNFGSVNPYVCYDSCGGTPAGSGCSGCTYSWSSEAPSIASISGTSSDVSVSVFGGSAGATYMDAYAYGMGCSVQLSPSPPVTVEADSTPILTGIDPGDWVAGTTQSVTFTGEYFGTNAPSLIFSPGTGISYSLTSYNDTQIVANVTVAAGTPNEDILVTVTSHGYGGSGFISTGGTSPTSTSIHARVHAPLNSPEVTVIAWVDRTAPDLVTLPSGANATLISNLNSGILNCVNEVGNWVLGYLGDVHTGTPDVDYANAWLVKNSANTAPPTTIVPETYYEGGNYRLFNDWGGNSHGRYGVGITPDPCGTGFIPKFFKAGQSSGNMGLTNTSGSGKVYQVAEGRIGKWGQLGSQTLNGNRTVPWIWSVIEFDSAGNPTTTDHATFPTYSVYVNGAFSYQIPQSTVKAFITGYDASNEGNWAPVP